MFSVSGMIRNVSSPITVTNATTGKQTTVFGTACIFFAFFVTMFKPKRRQVVFFKQFLSLSLLTLAVFYET